MISVCAANTPAMLGRLRPQSPPPPVVREWPSEPQGKHLGLRSWTPAQSCLLLASPLPAHGATMASRHQDNGNRLLIGLPVLLPRPLRRTAAKVIFLKCRFDQVASPLSYSRGSQLLTQTPLCDPSLVSPPRPPGSALTVLSTHLFPWSTSLLFVLLMPVLHQISALKVFSLRLL